MRVIGAALGLALVSVGSAPAEQSREALYSALAAHQCRLAPEQVAPVLAPLGFTRGFVRETLSELIVSGKASTDAAGVLSLPADLCPPVEATPTPKDALLEAFSENECRLTQENVPSLISRMGVSEAQLRAIVEPLHAAGDVTIAGRSATLSDSICDREA